MPPQSRGRGSSVTRAGGLGAVGVLLSICLSDGVLHVFRPYLPPHPQHSRSRAGSVASCRAAASTSSGTPPLQGRSRAGRRCSVSDSRAREDADGRENTNERVLRPPPPLPLFLNASVGAAGSAIVPVAPVKYRWEGMRLGMATGRVEQLPARRQRGCG
jgi:hypothetical protein